MPRLSSIARSRLVTAVLTCVALLASSAPARAAEERPVVYSLLLDEGPLDRCGGEPALERAVEERLRRAVFTGDDASDITIAIARGGEVGEPGPWRAEIVATDRAGVELGRRDVPMPADDCAKSLETLAVVLAIMIGPPRTTSEPPWQPPPPPEPEPQPAAPASPPAADRPPKRTPRRSRPRPEPLRWAASPLAAALGGSGVLPGFAWGVEVGGVVRPPVRRVSLVVRAAYWPAQTTPTLPPANVDRIGGSILGCYELIRKGGLALLGCGGAEASRIEARSTNFTIPAKSSVVAAAVGEARLGYRLVLRENLEIEPFLAPQLEVLLRRDRFTYRDPSGRERTLLMPAPAAFQGSFGVAVHFL